MGVSGGQMAVLALAGLFYGLSKTGIFGIAIVLVPLLLYLFTPGQALGLAIPMLVLADSIAIILFRKSVRWKVVFWALPWALSGIVIGWRVLAYAQSLPDNAGDPLLRKLISGFIVFIMLSGVVVKLLRARMAREAENADAGPPTLDRKLLAGVIATVGGFVTMIANNSAPAWVVYLMLFRLDKLQFLGTGAWLVFFLNASKLPFAIQLGYVNADTLGINLFMVPFLLVGVYVGKKIVDRVSQDFFDNLTQAIALLGGLYLLFSS